MSEHKDDSIPPNVEVMFETRAMKYRQQYEEFNTYRNEVRQQCLLKFGVDCFMEPITTDDRIRVSCGCHEKFDLRCVCNPRETSFLACPMRIQFAHSIMKNNSDLYEQWSHLETDAKYAFLREFVKERYYFTNEDAEKVVDLEKEEEEEDRCNDESFGEWLQSVHTLDPEPDESEVDNHQTKVIIKMKSKKGAMKTVAKAK